MTQDLLGLTIHVVPEAGFELEIIDAKEFFWEEAQISEQFELVLLNTCHHILHEHLSDAALPLSEEQIRVEVVGKYEREALEEWFAVGVEFAGEGHRQIAQSISVDARFSEVLCQTLATEVMGLLARETSIQHVSVEAELTSYASMWG